MALTIPKTSSAEFELVPEGNHVAVCVQIIDLGSHMESFDKKPEKLVRKIRIGWEIAEEVRNDGKPHIISKTYNYSGNEKSTFRKDLESWRGAKFTEEEIGNFRISNLLNKGCMLNVVHKENNERTYSNILSIARMPKGMQSPESHSEPVFFSLEPDEFSRDVYEALPEYLQEKITASPEWTNIAMSGNAPAAGEEDVPF